MTRARFFLLAALLVVLNPPAAPAQYTLDDTLKAVVPGLVYREYSRVIGAGNNWRVTDPDAPYVGDPANSPSTYLPNAVLNVSVDDLQGAVRAVAIIDCWGGHVGTVGKQFRLNGNPWIDIPPIQNTPGSPECYTHQYSVEVEVPLADLVSGGNSLEGTSGGQTCYSFGWGQWGWYGFVLRVYYDPAQKAPPTGMITSPASGDTIGEQPAFDIDATGPVGVSRVELIGRYDDYDHDGDGVYLDWQQSHHRLLTDYTMTIRNHMGTATTAPFGITWDDTWIPDQASGGIDVVARIRGNDGLWTVTDRVTGLTLDRPGINVKLYKASNVPQSFWVRAGWQLTSNFTVSGGPDLSTADAAQLLVATWNGVNGQAEPGEDHWTRVNNWYAPLFGENHFYSLDRVDVPTAELRDGSNSVTFFSQSSHHGNEILWPGPAMAVRYVDYSTVPAFVLSPPQDTFAFAGGTAVFSVEAAGADPIAYQWQRNGVDIPGANAATYVTPALTAEEDGDLFRCVVSNGLGNETSATAEVTVLVPGERETTGQVVLYGFGEGGGDTVLDVSGVGTPADLAIADTTAVTWLEGGLEITTPTLLATAGAVPKFTDAAMAGGAFSIEAWVQPANLTQNGPARIVSLSADSGNRNVTVGQGVYGAASNAWEVRLRSTATGTNGTPGLASEAGTLTTSLNHLVYTRGPGGNTRIYVDGVLQANGATLGNLSNWDPGYRLGLGNELTSDRPWLGRFYLVALFDRELSGTDVLQNFAAGPTTGPVAAPEIHAEVSFVTDPGGPASLFVLPDGSGGSLSAAQIWNGVTGTPPSAVDASIRVRLTDGEGLPVVGFPAASIGLAAQSGGWSVCPDTPPVADGPTDADGVTFISGPVAAGGTSAAGELLQVTIADPGLASTTYPGGLAGLDIGLNSADMDGNMAVDLGDVAVFAAAYAAGTSDFAADFHRDGAINLTDVTRLVTGFGALCAPVPPAPDSAPAGTVGLAFDTAGTIVSGSLEPGRRLTAHVLLSGPAASRGIAAWSLRLRTSPNVVVHDIVGEGAVLDLSRGADLVMAYGSPRSAGPGGPLVLARVQVSVTDSEPARFWLESVGTGGTARPGVVTAGRLQTIEPVSGDMALAVAGLNDPDFALEVPGPVVRSLALRAAPNPFNPRTEFAFVLPTAGAVRLQVFDARGRRVALLHDGDLPAGEHRLAWTGTDDAGRQQASGVYFARLGHPAGTLWHKLILVK